MQSDKSSEINALGLLSRPEQKTPNLRRFFKACHLATVLVYHVMPKGHRNDLPVSFVKLENQGWVERSVEWNWIASLAFHFSHVEEVWLRDGKALDHVTSIHLAAKLTLEQKSLDVVRLSHVL